MGYFGQSLVRVSPGKIGIYEGLQDSPEIITLPMVFALNKHDLVLLEFTLRVSIWAKAFVAEVIIWASCASEPGPLTEILIAIFAGEVDTFSR